MSGHSKWSKIKRQKQAKDVEKGAIFSKLSRLITLAVTEGGGIPDPDLNVRLRLAVEKAKQYNMPKDNITRAIEKGSGPDKISLKEVRYEAFAPHGVVMLIFAATDNQNRAITEVRNTLERHGGKLGNQGSVAYLFEKRGVLHFDKNQNSQDNILKFAEKIQAIDIDEDENTTTVYFPYENIGKVGNFLDNFKGDAPEVEFIASSSVSLNKEDQNKTIALIEAIEQIDDVQNVYTNAVFTE
ncbi:MAG: YebC/PmpR family DNA-binding transcriptional regulator [Candidatus Roizmanbacteria bacterium]|nr:MAG: YebC/PmpR family DNA-binding transcriptional regulator [Candidatus Roizmanbacteria bacterium]